MSRLRTLGVEEEFVLVDAATGQAALAAPELLRLLGGAGGGPPWARQEFMRFQFETATSVCTGLDQVRAELVGHRQAAAGAAEQVGCRLLAAGALPYGPPGPGLGAVTDKPRYRELARRFAGLAADAGTCGCHVHVGVASRDLGVAVLARIRPWLAPLLAISANSPISDGRDTGWASWRYPLWSRWPTSIPPKVWRDAADYDATVRRLVRQGAALDEPSVYFHARLSPRYPTVEIRVADVCLEVDDAVLLAGLARALVTTAAEEARRGVAVAAAPTRHVVAAGLAAALHGLGGLGVDPLSGRTTSQRGLVERLVDHVSGALAATGDLDEVLALLGRLDRRGTGASRQRACWARASSPAEFVQELADVTLAAAAPAGRPAAASGRGGSRVRRAAQPTRGSWLATSLASSTRRLV